MTADLVFGSGFQPSEVESMSVKKIHHWHRWQTLAQEHEANEIKKAQQKK